MNPCEAITFAFDNLACSRARHFPFCLNALLLLSEYYAEQTYFCICVEGRYPSLIYILPPLKMVTVDCGERRCEVMHATFFRLASMSFCNEILFYESP